MTLQDWLRDGGLTKHTTSPEEIRDLRTAAARDLRGPSRFVASLPHSCGGPPAECRLCPVMSRFHNGLPWYVPDLTSLVAILSQFVAILSRFCPDSWVP